MLEAIRALGKSPIFAPDGLRIGDLIDASGRAAT
jgi:hypothetical protein